MKKAKKNCTKAVKLLLIFSKNDKKIFFNVLFYRSFKNWNFNPKYEEKKNTKCQKKPNKKLGFNHYF